MTGPDRALNPTAAQAASVGFGAVALPPSRSGPAPFSHLESRMAAPMSIQAILYARGNEVVTISPGAPAAEAAEMLAVHNIAALAVVEAGAILGFVSGHEIIEAWSRHHHDLSAVTVRDILDPGVVSVSPDDS